jgi:hypothetical protein
VLQVVVEVFRLELKKVDRSQGKMRALISSSLLSSNSTYLEDRVSIHS